MTQVHDSQGGTVLKTLAGRDFGRLYDAPASSEMISASATDGVIALDAEWRFTYINKQAERLMWQSAKDVLGCAIWDVFPDAIGLPFQATYERARTTGRLQSCEAFSPHLSRWFAVNAYPTQKGGVAVCFRDVTANKQIELALRESEERFRTTFEHAPVGIDHVDPGGRWLCVNQRLCDILGYTREELLALTFQDITFAADLPLDLERMGQALRGEIATYEMEKRYVRKSGELLWCRLTVSLVRNPDGTPKYFIRIVEDISARKQAEVMLGSAAHELRTPVGHIKGFVSTLRRPDAELDADTRSEFTAEIESEADRLARLIEDLLEHASWSGGVVRRRQVTATPAALVGGSLERVRQELGARDVQVDVADDLPTVEVDVQSMERALENLLHNAHKYSPQDAPIHISADVRYRMLELHVDDHGPGIPVNERKHIFEPFYRRTSAADSSVPGKGLGLAICRSIVSAHGGEIRAEDAPDGGGRFTVALPVKGRSAQARRTGPAPSEQQCTCCGAERPTTKVRVFTPRHPNGSWRLCQCCWQFLEVGFKAHRPTENLEQRLSAVVPVNSTEVRGWIKTGLKQVGDHPRAARGRR